ncbi:HD domain-containing protein [bacterium A37T11]|nr:HD domain-containing protein [bacterium A37T11]
MDTNEWLTNLSRFVVKMFTEQSRPELVYHNLEHTKGVVIHVQQLANHYHLSPKDYFILSAAAWFHDIGHLFGVIAGHEERSVEIMKHYFSEQAIDKECMERVQECILATRMPTNPTTLLQQIICDADTFHLGTDEFFSTDPLIYRELELRLGCCIGGQTQKSIDFLEMHQFYTDYCKERLTEGKRKNMIYLASLIQKAQP